MHRRLSVEELSAVWSFIVVTLDPPVEVNLKVLDDFVDLLWESDLVGRFENRLVTPFADAIRLWALCFGVCVIDVFECEIELVLMPILFPIRGTGRRLGTAIVLG